MSRTEPTAVECAQLMFRCGRCWAQPGQWCRGVGKAAKYLHESRWQQVRKVNRLSGTAAALEAEWDRSRVIRNAIAILREDVEAWRVKSDAEIVERLHQIWAM